MVEINFECPKCGEEIKIRKRGMFSWGEGFEKEVGCLSCDDKTKITFLIEARD